MFQKIFRVRDFLKRGIISSADASELVSLLGIAMDASATALATPLAWGDFNISEGIPGEWVLAYMRFRQWDPLIQRVCHPATSSWIRGNEDLAHLHGDNPCASAFFEHFIDCMGLRIKNPFGADHCFAIYRERGKSKFGIAERDAMNLLIPHLSAALRTRTVERILREPATEPVLATVVLRYPERVAEWSQEARHMIRRALPGVCDSAFAKLEEALFRAAWCFYASAAQAAVPIVGTVRADFAVVRTPGTAALLAILSDTPVHVKARLFPFEELLTWRERQIARSLAQGLRLEEAANQHQISRETAKSHVKALYRKLAIGTRAELARLYAE